MFVGHGQPEERLIAFTPTVALPIGVGCLDLALRHGQPIARLRGLGWGLDGEWDRRRK